MYRSVNIHPRRIAYI